MRTPPADATHVWTPAISTPWFGGTIFRRAYYKKIGKTWLSFNVHGVWVVSGNDDDWFDEETRLGYFVPIETFNAPWFVPVPEKL